MKKTFKAIILICFTLLSTMLIALGVHASPIPGDVNGDGEVNIRDAATILQYISGHNVQLIAPCDHVGSVVIDPAVAATCTDHGKTAGIHCTACEEVLLPQETIIAQGHTYDDWIIDKQPTKTEDGTKHQLCLICGDTITTSIIPATGSIGLNFTLNSDNESYSVSKGTCTDTEVVIPAVYNGMPVTSIDSSAFYPYTSLTSVTIPDSIKSIGKFAFFCSKLTSITIPNSVTSIGEQAFTQCTNLTSVTIPNSVTSIGSGVFYDCTSLSSISIPESVTSIAAFAFAGCTNLTSVTIPNTVTSIGLGAFYDCTGIKTVNFDGTKAEWESLIANSENNNEALTTAIVVFANGEHTDYNDPKYLEYTLNSDNSTYSITGIGLFNGSVLAIPSTYKGKNITAIGAFAFSRCNNLTKITIGSNVTSIGAYAFSRCDALTKVVIPDEVSEAGEYTFYMCPNLTTVELSTNSKLTVINKYMFHWCEKLTSITIPKGVTRIENSAFYGCENLTSIAIPSKVTYIGDSAFSNTGLKSITIPFSVISIDRAAFCNCAALTTFNYAGTKSQWNSTTKGNQWADYSAFSKVHCTNGDIDV